MSVDAWLAALDVDPSRRDHETVLAEAVRAAWCGVEPPWASLHEPERRRRTGYLLDVAQTMRGRTADEAARLAALRGSLGEPKPVSFWPGETPLPPGTDPVAERWGFVRGCNMGRLKAALRRPARLLPARASRPAP